MKFKWYKLVSVIAAVILLTLGTYAIIRVIASHESQSRPAPAQPFDPSQGPVVQGSAEGEDVNVNSKLPGKIATVQVKEGQQVKAGDVIATLQCDDIQSKREQAASAVAAAQGRKTQAQAGYDAAVSTREQAKAGLAAKQAAYEQAKAGARAAQYQVAAAQSVQKKADNGARKQELAQAQAQYDLWKKTFERVTNLYAKGAVPAQKVDEVKAQLDVAKQTLSMAKEGAREEDKESAEANVGMAMAGSDASNTLVAQAEAGVAAAQAQLQQAEAGVSAALATLQQAVAGVEAAEAQLKEVDSYLNDAVIRAPRDGLVTAVNVKAGELVSTGMPIATISNSEKINIDFKVRETDIKGIAEGQDLPVKFAALPGQSFTGKVTSVSTKPDYAVKRSTGENGDIDIVSYSVKVSVDNPDGKIRAGMTAFAQLRK